MWPDCARDATGLALLHGARDNPDEDDRRLILADWLDDQGEELVAHLLRQSLALSTWVVFPGVTRSRWLPWNGCWRGWPGIQARGGFHEPRDFPDSPWLCVVDLTYQLLPLHRQPYLDALAQRGIHVLLG